MVVTVTEHAGSEGQWEGGMQAPGQEKGIDGV